MSKSSDASNAVIDAVGSLRCTLGTILGMAESNSYNAVSEIAHTARAGIARLNLILPSDPAQKENGVPCDYFRAQDCLAGCPLVACQEAGSCQKSPGVAT